jgi:DNA-binding LacI/PurR family transcriptional regulator
MVTIKDVAREAGVSHPTVSLVLNGKAKQLRISDAVSERIKAAAIRLGYQRNEIARSMVTGQSTVLGLLLPETTREYCARIINGVMKAVSEHERYIKVIYVAKGNSAENIASQCIGQRVDGVICYNIDNRIDLSQLHKLLLVRKIPLCMAASCRSFGTGIHVTPDDALGGKLVFNHLYELGHRNFLIPLDYCESSWSKQRFDGFCQAAAEAGVEIRKNHVIRFSGKGVFTVETLKKIFSAKKPPTAIFCLYDDMALHIMTILQSIGIRVPDDVSITGYGNMSYGTRCVPSLTTIEEQLENIGRKSVELLLGEIKEDTIDSAQEEMLTLGEVKLIVRDSTKPVISAGESERESS